ncbi:hypothetical protein OJAV_G00159160 [Oryzias javanicus]|uniref:Pre-rRNA-processing protein Ipi1 N-terminal domain-containing protein n=1 Tax=Oryzias javanicus TaxID=123683 RepID=A0A3S2NYW3_ORYJA|nr:hypothetical protein OJAV_G00159160 [Oryzias javanicus]
MKSKKKKRQDDFQKVKLKVGKKKPRADNATNTNFRSRGIHLPEQLKRDTSGPTTHRQLGVNDLLSQLHHYNANVKHSALMGLKELLTSNSSLLEQHLSRLLSEVAAVLTDKDGNVRVAATRVIRIIAQCVPAERVAPFFPLLSAHLSCAMTHIEASIQEDAMNVLDVFLEHYSSLLAQRPGVLLTNFLEMISHRQNAGAKKPQDLKGRSWSLSVNLDRAVTSQQWRLSVLLRLGRFLQAVVENRPGETGEMSVPTEGVFDSSGEGHATTLYVKWEDVLYRKAGVKVFEHSGAKPSPQSTFRLRPELDSGSTVSEGLDSISTVQSFAATLVPLLLEVWVEASASDGSLNSTEGAHLLTQDAMSVMFQVLNILQLLRKLTPKRENQDALDAWFRKEYLGEFKQHFMKNFPYGIRDTPRHKKKTDLKRSKPNAPQNALLTVEPLAFNITLCQVMVSLSQKQSVSREAEGEWLTPLRTFVRETLGREVKLSYQQLHMLLGTVWKMVLTQRSRTVTEELLASVYIYYKQKSLLPRTRFLLLSFYNKLYLEEQGHTHIARSKVMSRWLASLPVQLSQLGHRNPKLSAELITAIQAAASRGNKDLLNSLETHACTLYDPQDGVMVLLPAEFQKPMVQLLYFLPNLSQPLLANLSSCCSAGRISAGLAASLIRILHFRSSLNGWSVGNQEAALQDVDYFSFLFSTLTGFSSESLADLQEDEGTFPPTPLSPLCLHPTPLDQFTHHWDVVEEVCHCLETMGSKSQCFDILQNGICKYLSKFEVIPDSMAAGLLRAVSRLLDLSILPLEPVLRFLSHCCLSLLALLVALQQEAPTETNHKREAIWSCCITALSRVPRLLRMVLQSMRSADVNEKRLPQLGQILSMLLQHTPLHNQLLANATLLQEIMLHLTRYSRGGSREQWLTDLLYCYSVTMSHSSSTHRGSLGLRDMY